MPYINDTLRDSGLTTIASGTVRVDICHTAEPTTYAAATSTNTCGNKTGVATGAIADASTDGRSVSTAAITDGSVTASQTAGWWAITNGVDTLYAAGALSASQAVTSGNTFTLDAIEVTIRDAA